MILREVAVITTGARVYNSDIPALELLAESNVEAITASQRISLEALVEDGLRPLAERRSAGKILVNRAA
jgi:hypothetical protein